MSPFRLPAALFSLDATRAQEDCDEIEQGSIDGTASGCARAYGAATIAAAKLASYIGSKVQNEYLRGTLTRLDDAVLVAVKELQQTVVAEIKAAAENGKLDETTRQRVKDAALANVKSYVGQKGFNVIANVLGLSNELLEQFIRARIEAAVHDLRVVERGATSSVVVTNTLPPTTDARPPAATPAVTSTPAAASGPGAMVPEAAASIGGDAVLPVPGAAS